MSIPSAARVLVTRAAQGGSELAAHLRALGADPILIPAIEIAEPTSFAALDAALAHLDAFHWLLFTSANAVEAFAHRFQHPLNPDGARAGQPGALPVHLPTNLKIAVIGPATATALQKIGLIPDLTPPQAVAESLTSALLPQARQPDGRPTRLLLIRAEEAREHLPETLRHAGAEITVAPAYRTVIPETSITLLRDLFRASEPRVPHPQNRVPHSFAASSRKGGVLSSEAAQRPIDAITFTSSSTARNLVALCEAAGVTLPATALRISIGPVTSQTLRELGLRPDAESPEATVNALAQTVMHALRERPQPGP